MTSTSIRTLEISGIPAERGRQYGEGAADLIDAAVAYYEEAFGQQAGLGWAEARRRAAAWVPRCTEAAPELVAELEGIAAGAGRDLLDLMVLNLRGEIIYDQGGTRPARDEDPSEERDASDGCTSFSLTAGASGDGHQYAGQNWDWRTGTRDTVVIVRVVQDPLPTLIMQLEAGQIGRHGVNSAGLALNANGLGGRFDGAVGLPQTFIRRMTLNQSELPDAINTLVRTPAHIASNALLTDRSGFSIDLEITPSGVDWVYPVDGLLVHGNHYQAQVPPQLAGRYRPVSADSLFRVPQARAGLERVRHAADRDAALAGIRAAMSDHLGYPESVCTHPDERRPAVRQWSTLLSSCVDLTTGDYFVTAGTPCDHPYEKLPWNAFDGPGSRHTPVHTPPMEALR
ncbi:C45 family autoproteolytic acyltransferase/hydolase [Agromyces mediolanus]|uniref:C45 family autoproteolytic acyltransferase/hydolase n=1 Tax=Agromyces mediolanus TaxID=41986 RepID=UPI001E3760F0|nr:C45 family peptidase [Agromyces mediolanus]MCD1570505.1 C45 family peptidase [Agromyces mediolanus]